MMEGPINPGDDFPILLPLEQEQEGKAGLVSGPSLDIASGSTSTLQTTHATKALHAQSLVLVVTLGDVPLADPSTISPLIAPEVTPTIDVDEDIFLNLEDISDLVSTECESI